MIKLYQFPSAGGMPNASPFCMKVEVMLRLLDLPYEIVPTNDLKNAPKHKLPFIEDGEVRVPDSEVIRQYLEKKTGRDLNEGLSVEERAVAHAFARMLEERTYFILMRTRWIDEKNYPILKKTFYSELSFFQRHWIPYQRRKRLRGYLYGQGTGRHEPELVRDFGVADIKAIATYMGEKQYFMGDKPTAADATIYPFLIGIAIEPFATAFKDELRKYPNLMGYMDQMRQKVYPQ